MAVAQPPSAAFERPTGYRDELVARSDRVRLLLVPERRCFSVDGTDAPGSQGFRDAIASLYPLAYTLHFALKRRGVEAPVGALEGLFWIGQPGPIPPDAYDAGPGVRGAWNWRLLLPVPDAATDAEVDAARADVAARKRPPLLDRVRCERWEEGPAAQIMHVGPYDAERPTIERLHRAIGEDGLRARGCHHEIYLSDPGRTKPERMKTLIRQPVEPAR